MVVTVVEFVLLRVVHDLHALQIRQALHTHVPLMPFLIFLIMERLAVDWRVFTWRVDLAPGYG